jgi:hypothetical protein
MKRDAQRDEDICIADMHSRIVTTTRKIRGAMEDGRWKMWTARCDRVHRKENEDTITERERAYAKIKQFWVQHVGMRRMDKSMVEVLQMSKEVREQWMQQVKGREYPTTRMGDYFDVRESQPRTPKEKTTTTARAPSNNNKLTAMGFKRTRNGEQRDRETAENEEVVEVETANNETTQDQTQTEQRGAARSRPEWMNRYGGGA